MFSAPLVKAIGLIAQQYPYTYLDLQHSRPDVSFPDTPTMELLALYGVYPVTSVEVPAHNPKTHRPLEGMPVHVDGTWLQTWSLRPTTQDEVDAGVKSEKFENLRRELSTTQPQQSVPALVARIEKLEQYLGLKPVP